MVWTDKDLRRAELIHGPDGMNADTYLLWLKGEGDKAGKMLNVPGWMVGDPRGVDLRTKAAAVIRERLQEQYDD